MAIQTNISLTAPQKEYFQRFVNLSVNEEALPQGDGVIRISPFDDYFLFTLYDEIDSEDTPIDLSNVGDIFINFIGTNDEINVKNHTQVAEVDLSQGEVLFRITKSDSKKVLALNNNNFYISTKMVSEEDGSISDESVLYQGTWLAFDTASRVTLTSQIEEQRLEYSIELARLKEENVSLKNDNSELINISQADIVTIQALQASNDELVNEVTELRDEFGAGTFGGGETFALANRAKEASALQRKNAILKQQSIALRKTDSIYNNQKDFYKVAANNLQQYSI
tara:strand:+ start:1179 stop:2024 length:846 start_codon:yes stop_codon:yes gene_type:complete